MVVFSFTQICKSIEWLVQTLGESMGICQQQLIRIWLNVSIIWFLLPDYPQFILAISIILLAPSGDFK